MSTPRPLSFAVGTSLLTASLSLGVGCADKPKVEKKSDEKHVNEGPKTIHETVNEGPEPEPPPEKNVNPGPEVAPEPPKKVNPGPIRPPSELNLGPETK
jgi:hypothetical protein